MAAVMFLYSRTTLTCARRTDDGDDLAAMHFSVDVTQYVKTAVAFLKVGDLDEA